MALTLNLLYIHNSKCNKRLNSHRMQLMKVASHYNTTSRINIRYHKVKYLLRNKTLNLNSNNSFIFTNTNIIFIDFKDKKKNFDRLGVKWNLASVNNYQHLLMQWTSPQKLKGKLSLWNMINYIDYSNKGFLQFKQQVEAQQSENYYKDKLDSAVNAEEFK